MSIPGRPSLTSGLALAAVCSLAAGCGGHATRPTTPLSAAPVLVVDSAPEAAHIALDGTPTGRLTPTTFTGLASGAHAIALSRAGYDDTLLVTQVDADSATNRVRATLRRIVLPYVRAWGSRGFDPGAFVDVSALAIDPDGFVYATDWGLDRIQKFTADGTFVLAWTIEAPAAGGLGHPAGIAYDPTGGHLAISENANHRVRFYATNGFLTGGVGTEGAGTLQFERPLGVAFPPGGDTLLVCDGGNARLAQIPLGLSGITHVGIAGPMAVCCLSDGRRCVLQNDGGAEVDVAELDAAGHVLRRWGSEGVVNGHFTSPRAIAVGPGDHVFVATGDDLDPGAVEEFTANGDFVAKWVGDVSATSFFSPRALVFAANGDLLLADSFDQRIKVFRP